MFGFAWRAVAVGGLVFLTVGCQSATPLAMSAQRLDGGDWIDVAFKNLSPEDVPLLIEREDVLHFEVKDATGRYTASRPPIRPGVERSQIVVIPPHGTLIRRVQLNRPFLAEGLAPASAGSAPLRPAGATEATGIYGQLLVTYKTDDLELAHPSNMPFWRGVVGPVDAGRILLTSSPHAPLPQHTAQAAPLNVPRP